MWVYFMSLWAIIMLPIWGLDPEAIARQAVQIAKEQSFDDGFEWLHHACAGAVAGETIGSTVGGALGGAILGSGLSALGDLWTAARSASALVAARSQAVEGALQLLAEQAGLDQTLAREFAEYAGGLLSHERGVNTVGDLLSRADDVQNYLSDFVKAKMNQYSGTELGRATIPTVFKVPAFLANPDFVQNGLQSYAQMRQAIKLILPNLIAKDPELVEETVDHALQALRSAGINSPEAIKSQANTAKQLIVQSVAKNLDMTGQDTAFLIRNVNVDQTVDSAIGLVKPSTPLVTGVETVSGIAAPSARALASVGAAAGSTIGLTAALSTGLSQMEACYVKGEEALKAVVDKTLLNGRYGYLHVSNTTNMPITITFDWVGGPKTSIQVLGLQQNRVFTLPGWHLRSITCTDASGGSVVLKRPAAGLAVGINQVIGAQLYMQASTPVSHLAARKLRGFEVSS